MGILDLKRKTAYKFIKNQLNKDEDSSSLSLDQIKKVGVIVNKEQFNTYDFTKRLCEYFGNDRDDFEIIKFSEDKNVGNDELVFSESSFKMNGKIKSKEVLDFAEQQFDLLINYCNPENLFANVLVVRSKGILKTGFFNEEDNFYNLSIKTSENRIDTFNEELTKYLKILKLI